MAYYLVLFLFIIFGTNAANIAVLSSRNKQVYSDIIKEFKETVDGQGHHVLTFNLSKDQDYIYYMELFSEKEISHIFAIGKPAAKIASYINVPGVFTMVLRPDSIDLLNKNGIPQNQLTGVLIQPHFTDRLNIINELSLNPKLGLIFHPNYKDFVLNLTQKGSEPPFSQISYFPVDNKDMILPTFEKNKSKVDLFMSVLDLHTYNAKTTKHIIKFSVMNRVPLIGFNHQMVKAGALMGIYCSFPALGRQSGQRMLQLLKNKNEVLAEPAQFPHEIKYALNTKIAKIMGIKLSERLVNGADKIFS